MRSRNTTASPAPGGLKLSNYAKPVIAQIRGFCMGGGLGIAMSTDIRIASDDSQFGIPAAKLSIAYGFDMVRALVDLVGPAHAHMILMTGERFGAKEAERSAWSTRSSRWTSWRPRSTS